MNKSFRKHLTAGETELIESTQPGRLADLDEDELSDLLSRVRRAARKYRVLHRRQASAQVAEDRSRARASTKNLRTAVKAEAFEEALARTSASLAKAARATARELKAERLALAASARPDPSAPDATGRSTTGPAPRTRARAKGPAGSPRSTATTKRRADTQAQGARRQDKRDSR